MNKFTQHDIKKTRTNIFYFLSTNINKTVPMSYIFQAKLPYDRKNDQSVMLWAKMFTDGI